MSQESSTFLRTTSAPAAFDRLPTEEEETREIIRRMRAVRADLSSTQASCQKTLETTSCCLKEHFQHMLPEKLGEHIALRFAYFDKDKNGVLDRAEVTEAMAEMGQRPTDEELDGFFRVMDRNKDAKIDLKEFANLVRLKLKLISAASISEEANMLAEKELKAAQALEVDRMNSLKMESIAPTSSKRVGRTASLPTPSPSLRRASLTKQPAKKP